MERIVDTHLFHGNFHITTYSQYFSEKEKLSGVFDWRKTPPVVWLKTCTVASKSFFVYLSLYISINSENDTTMPSALYIACVSLPIPSGGRSQVTTSCICYYFLYTRGFQNQFFRLVTKSPMRFSANCYQRGGTTENIHPGTHNSYWFLTEGKLINNEIVLHQRGFYCSHQNLLWLFL